MPYRCLFLIQASLLAVKFEITDPVESITLIIDPNITSDIISKLFKIRKDLGMRETMYLHLLLLYLSERS